MSDSIEVELFPKINGYWFILHLPAFEDPAVGFLAHNEPSMEAGFTVDGVRLAGWAEVERQQVTAVRQPCPRDARWQIHESHSGTDSL